MDEKESTLISELSNKLEIDLPEKKTIEELKLLLSGYISHLISNNPDKLVSILSRVDVSEKMLKANLQNQDENASSIMAQMIIDRQMEKIKTRERYRSSDDISEDEKVVSRLRKQSAPLLDALEANISCFTLSLSSFSLLRSNMVPNI